MKNGIGVMEKQIVSLFLLALTFVLYVTSVLFNYGVPQVYTGREFAHALAIVFGGLSSLTLLYAM